MTSAALPVWQYTTRPAIGVHNFTLGTRHQ